MKDSGVEWIGEITKEWDIIKGKYIYDVLKGKLPTLQTSKINADYVPYLSMDYQRSEIQPKEFAEKNDGVAAEVDDIVILWDGSNAGEIFKSKAGILSSTTALIKIDQNINKEYVFYSLKSAEEDLKSKNIGMGIPHVNGNELKNNNYTLPDIQEQQKIASFLDEKVAHIDNILEDTKISIEYLKTYKQSLITEIVTKGLKDSVEMKDSEIQWIGEIPKTWFVSKMKYITFISRGQFSHRPRNDVRFYDGPYPFLQTGDVTKAEKFITSYSQTLNEKGKDVSIEFPKGTLVMSIAANIGDIAVLDFDAYFPDSILGLTPKKGFYWDYLYYVYLAMKPAFLYTAVSNTQLNLSIDRIKEIYVPVSNDIVEQREIANFSKNLMKERVC